MSSRTVELVQRSWAAVMPMSDAAATLFYVRLFELDPSVRSLFKSDLREQKKKLMQTLSVAVDGLRDPDKLVPVLQQLGVRHAGYMVVDRHYDAVGDALLWTLREGLGDLFTAEVETAWREVYTFVADVMKNAASGRIAKPAGSAPIPKQVPARQSSPPIVPSAPTPSPAPVTPPPPARPVADVGVSARSIGLVQRSWASIMPITDAAATMFYNRLFEIDPSVRHLFKSDLREQKKKLMQTLGIAVDGLSSPGKLVPVLEQLGVRHAGYMVTAKHYDVVGEALLWTLREGLGEGFTRDVESAWREVYDLVARTMKAAAERAAGPTTDGATPHARGDSRAPAPAPDLPEEATAQTPREPVLAAARAADARVDAGDPRPIVVSLGGRELTLNVHVKLDGAPLMRPPDERAATPDPLGVAFPLIVLFGSGAVLAAAASGLARDWDLASPHGTWLGTLVAAPLFALSVFSLAAAWRRRTGRNR